MNEITTTPDATGATLPAYDFTEKELRDQQGECPGTNTGRHCLRKSYPGGCYRCGVMWVEPGYDAAGAPQPPATPPLYPDADMDETAHYGTLCQYDYATDAGYGTIHAESVEDAYDDLRSAITSAMISDGATLWVEPADMASHETRLTMGVDRD